MQLYIPLALILLVPTLVLANPPGSARVRTLDSRVRAALAEGSARSATFRDVVAQIEQHDVIVYVEMKPYLRNWFAGKMTWVVLAPPFRYVRVGLNPELTGSSLVAALAHELQHVLEVANAPSIVDARSLSAYYRAIGRERSGRSDEWDTDAAQLIGAVVRRELATAEAGGDEPVLLADAAARVTVSVPTRER